MFKQVRAGEWVIPRMSNYKVECCDCGLIHTMDFLVIHEETHVPLNSCKVMFRAYRKEKKKKRKK